MGGQRAEGLDHLRPVREVVHARRPHRPRRAQAQGPHLLPDGHGAGGRRSQASGPDHRRGRVQRGLHERGADPRRQRRRRRRQRLVGGDHDADERARRARLRRDLPDRQQPQAARGAGRRDPRQRRHRRRGPLLPPADRPAPHRGRDDAPQRLSGPDQDDAVRDPGARGLARQVAVGRHQPGNHRARPRHRGRLRAPRPRRRARPRQRRLAVRVPPLPRQLDRGRHDRHPQEHHRRARPRPAEDALPRVLRPHRRAAGDQVDRPGLPRRPLQVGADPRAGRLRRRLRAVRLGGDGRARLAGLALPEEWGGQGLGIVDLAVLFEEMGYALAPSPLLSNTVAGLALALLRLRRASASVPAAAGRR